MPIRRRNLNPLRVDRDTVLDKEFEDLEPHELRWLQDTEFWPEGQEHKKQPVTFMTHTGQEVSNDPVFLLSQGDRGSEALQRMIEARAQQMVQELTQRQAHEDAVNASGEYTGTATGDPKPGQKLRRVPDDLDVPPPGSEQEIPYDMMDTQALRGEALRRDLPIDGENGKKSGKLIQNIEEWDEAHPEGVDAYEEAKDK